MKNNIGTVTRQPNGLYLDSHKRNLLIDFKNEIIYVVDKDNVKKYMLFRTRYVLALMIAIAMVGYTNWYIGLTIGVVSLILMEISYRFSFLNSLEQIKNVEMPKKMTQYDVINAEDKKSVIKRIIAFTLLTIIICGNCYYYVFVKNVELGIFSQNNILMIVLSIIFLCISIYMDIVSIKVMINKKNK
jgi:hypothetical protein